MAKPPRSKGLALTAHIGTYALPEVGNSTATRGDKTLESHLIFTFHSRDGKVSEVWGTSLDDYATDEFWA